MVEDIPSVWKERANNGRPVRTAAFLLVLSSGLSFDNDPSIFPDVATTARREERRGERTKTGRKRWGNLYPSQVCLLCIGHHTGTRVEFDALSEWLLSSEHVLHTYILHTTYSDEAEAETRMTGAV